MDTDSVIFVTVKQFFACSSVINNIMKDARENHTDTNHTTHQTNYRQSYINMEKQIQELTDLLYKEGVEKGNAQADVILTEAKQNAAKIVAQAKAEAEALLAQARREQEELRRNTQNELKLYAGQTVEAAKSAVTNTLSDRLSREAAEAVTTDARFLQEVILRLVSAWSEKEELVVGTEDAKALRAYFAQKAKTLLDKGVQIEEVNGLKHAFTVAPADGSYKMLFGEGEFEALFRDFLRPALVDMLYE